MEFLWSYTCLWFSFLPHHNRPLSGHNRMDRTACLVSYLDLFVNSVDLLMHSCELTVNIVDLLPAGAALMWPSSVASSTPMKRLMASGRSPGKPLR